MARAEPYPGTQAIRRAVSILKAFDEERPERTLAELSESLGLNKTTVYRALAALEGEGLVSRLADGEAYRLGPELIALGARALRANDLRTTSRPELQELAVEAGETATLEILVDGEMLILDEVKGSGLLGMHAEIGTRWPMHATSTGKAFLAALQEHHGGSLDSDHAFPTELPPLTPHTRTSREQLEADLVRAREQGYAVAYEELQPGYAAVGAAIRNHDGRPVAVVGIGGPTSRLTRRRLGELGKLVRNQADKVSRKLGAAVAGPV